MSTLTYVLFLWVASFTRRLTCLNLIDLPMVMDIPSDIEKAEHSAKSEIIQSRLLPKTSNKFGYSLRKAAKMPSPTYEEIEVTETTEKSTEATTEMTTEVEQKVESEEVPVTRLQYPPLRPTTRQFDIRRYFVVGNDGGLDAPNPRASPYEDEKDKNLKTKITTLVQQTIHDTERKIRSIGHIKEKHRDQAPYKAGFILSLIKKSRDMLNELFNVAVKHKDEWRALEQLKIFELIVHTNVDTTNLVRQLVEVHIQHLNATNPNNDEQKRRVVLL